MRAEEVRELSETEIADRVAELEEERFRLRFRSATETLEEPLRARVIRRDIARMKTVLSERRLGKSSPARKARRKKAAAPGGKVGRSGSARGGRKR